MRLTILNIKVDRCAKRLNMDLGDIGVIFSTINPFKIYMSVKIMKIYSEWTKKEVIELTGLSRGKLEYLDRVGLLKPIRYGSLEMPTMRYTWEHLIMLKAYSKIREKCSLQALREAFDFLKLENPMQHIADKRLIACSKKVYWINLDYKEFVTLVSGGNKGQGQFLFAIEGDEILREIWDSGENKVLNFAERAKEKPLSRLTA